MHRNISVILNIFERILPIKISIDQGGTIKETWDMDFLEPTQRLDSTESDSSSVNDQSTEEKKIFGKLCLRDSIKEFDIYNWTKNSSFHAMGLEPQARYHAELTTQCTCHKKPFHLRSF